MTEFADDGDLQLFDFLEIVGIYIFIEEVQKEEVQGTDFRCERNGLRKLF